MSWTWDPEPHRSDPSTPPRTCSGDPDPLSGYKGSSPSPEIRSPASSAHQGRWLLSYTAAAGRPATGLAAGLYTNPLIRTRTTYHHPAEESRVVESGYCFPGRD